MASTWETHDNILDLEAKTVHHETAELLILTLDDRQEDDLPGQC